MKELLKIAEQHYGLTLTFLEKVTEGFLSENYILTDGEARYFLKKYRFDDREHIQTIHTIKKYFSTGGIPIILPLLTKSGDTIVTHNNSHYALFPFVEGNHFARGDLPKEAIISLGEMLGKIHLHGKDGTNLTKRIFSLTIDNEKALGKIERLLEIINQKNDLDEFDILAKKNLTLKKDLIIKNNLTNEDIYLPSDHLIHGDYHDRNVFFDASNNVSNVFDLEKSVNAPRTFELLRSMTYALLHDSVTEEKLHDCKIYCDAYRSIYPLQNTELQKGIQFFIVKSLYNVWIEEEHYLENNARVDIFLESDFLRLSYLRESPDYLEKTLLVQ